MIPKEFIDLISSNLLHQKVLGPTLNDNFLDLVFTNEPNSIYNIEIGPPLSCTDKNHLHNSLHWDVILEDDIKTFSHDRLAFNYGKYDDMNTYFNSIDWQIELEGKLVQEQYEIFLQHYNKACKTSIPIKRTSQLKKPCPKWYNKDVKCGSNAKKRATKNAKS